MTSWEEQFSEAARGRTEVIWPRGSWRTRIRLGRNRAVDHAAVWLVDNVHWRAGMWLWRACGMWRRRAVSIPAWIGAAAITMARDRLWADPPPLDPGCGHDPELLPVVEFRQTIVCRKCGGLDVEASRTALR